MPVRALRPSCARNSAGGGRGLKTMNAREGIKTYTRTSTISKPHPLKTMNAREGIKTQRQASSRMTWYR